MRRIDTCKRGHDQTVEGARSPSYGCIACRKVRDEKRKAALPPKAPKVPATIPEDLIEELRKLQAQSSKTNRQTPEGHEYRKAGDLLAELAGNAMAEYEVTASRLSLQMGLSEKTMPMFLMRRGVIPQPPSHEKAFKPYGTKAGPRKPKEACNRGHSYLEEGARNKWGTCRICESELKKARYDPAKERAKYLAKKLAA